MRFLGARELEVLEEVEGVSGVPDTGGEFLDGGKNRAKVSRDEFSGAGAGRDNGSAGEVRFVDFGKEIETGGVGLGNYEVGGCGREVTCGDEVMNGLRDDGLVIMGRVIIEGAVGGAVRESAPGLSDVE
eukprot:g38076.t1